MRTTLRLATQIDKSKSTSIGYFSGFVVLGLAMAVLGPTLPFLAENTHTQLSEISFLFSARSLGYLLSAIWGGRLYDRYPGHLVMASGLLLLAGSLFLSPLIPLLWLLVAAMFLLGLGESMVDIGGNTLLVWLHGHKVGPYMNALHFFFGVGAFLSPIIVARAILLSGGITWAYWVLALLVLPVALGVIYLPSPDIRHEAETSHTVRRANLLLVGLISLFFFLYVGAEVSFGGWIFTYTVALNITTEPVAAYLTSAFWGALTVGRLLTIPLAARLRPRSVIGGALAGCLLSVAIILLWPNLLVAIWVGTLGIGMSMASIFPLTLSLAGRRMAITGQITGWFFVGGSLGAMSVPWLIGQFFEQSGPISTMLIIGLDLLVAVAVFIVMLVYSKPIRPGLPQQG